MVREVPPFRNYPDADTERALEWFLGFLDRGDWRQRVERIEAHLDAIVKPHPSDAETQRLSSVSIADDRMAWYLYLVDTALHDCLKYEPIQGSRVLPVFSRFGAHLNLLQRVINVEDRVVKMLTSDRAQPDSALFELLVALLWARNGCERVEFISEDPPERRPDIRAWKRGEEWVIECKRLQQSSEYSLSERENWLAMWTPLRDSLITSRISVVFDIVFHVELDSLSDDFLAKQLPGKLALVQLPCKLISNEVWEVSAKPVEYEAARAHLRKYLVRFPSDQLNELVAGRRNPNRGFTSVVLGNFVSVGEHGGNNRFLDQMEFAAGAFWSCDAPEAIRRKARDIRGHLSKAVSQLPDQGKSAIHVALETLDGPEVETERFLRIVQSVLMFDALGKDLQWIYCHQLQFYAPPDELFVVDETVHHFGRRDCADEPLASRAVLIPANVQPDEGVHWLKEPP